MRLRVYEGMNAIYIEHVPSGEVRCAGCPDDFYAGLADMQREAATDDWELMEAYFPEKLGEVTA